MNAVRYIVASCLLAVACSGPPSALDACHKSCDKQGECTSATALAIFQCKTDCDSMKAQLEDSDTTIEHNCSNADDVRSEIYSCYSDYCEPNLAQQCATEAYQVKCDPKL